MRLPSAVGHALAVLALSRVAQSFATPGTPACSVATSCGASAVSMALRGGMEMPPIMYGTAWKKEGTASFESGALTAERLHTIADQMSDPDSVLCRRV